MGCTRLCRTSAAIAMSVATLVPSPALANPSDAQLQAARKLFLQAEQDEDAGRWSDALAKLHEVSQVKLTAGVRYHVALCEQNLGQLATALADYILAESQSHGEDAHDVLRLVGKRLDDLRPRVPRVVVHVVPARADAVVTLDGKVISASEADAGILADPGTHRLEASAPNAPLSSMSVTLREQEVTVVDLRMTTKTVVATTAPPPPDAAVAGGSGAHAFPAASSGRAAAIVTTVGAVTLAAGGLGAYLLAGSAHERGLTECASIVGRLPDACEVQRSGVRSWDFTAAAAWTGAFVAGTVAVVLWTAHSDDERGGPAVRVGFVPGAVELQGHF